MLFMWSVAFTATLGSLYFSEVRQYEPCELCWYQRILMYPLVIILGVAYAQKNAKIAVTTLVFSLIGLCISAYHYSIQKFSFMQDSAPACGRVPCTGQYINYLGFITIPFLALIAFLLIAISSMMILRSIKEEKVG